MAEAGERAPATDSRTSLTDPFSAVALLCLAVAWPFSLRLDPRTRGFLRTLTWAGSGVAGLAAFLGRGPGPALLAAVAFLPALYNLAHGIGRFLRASQRDASTWAEAMWASGLCVATTAWVWSRYDGSFAGFPDPLATLTVAHFTVTFGLLPAGMAAWNRSLENGEGLRFRQLGSWGMVTLPPLVGLLFATRSAVLTPSFAEVALTAGMAFSFACWWAGAAGIRMASFPLLIGVFLGSGYAWAQWANQPFLGYSAMLGSHGLLNLLGVCLLVGLAPVPTVQEGPPEPDPVPPLAPGDEKSALFLDHRHRPLGPWSPEAFETARRLLLGYHFYPDDVMRRTTQFEQAGRPAQVGDRIGLGLLLPSLPGLPPILLPAISEIYDLVDEPERICFGYATTTNHYGEGRWHATIIREGDRLELTVFSHIRPSRWYVWLGLPVYRYFQSRAFHKGADNLCKQLSSPSGG